jgi:hypothetical protein
MNLAQLITRWIIRNDAHYRHPDCTAVDTWAQMQKLAPYHGTLAITLKIMSRN